MNYVSPDVYIQDVVTGSGSSEQTSASVGAMIGVTPSGKINEPRKVTSFTEYVEEFANGLASPFLENDYLSYAVHGFFVNGGRELYVTSLKKTGVKATATGETSGLSVTAISEGAWGNDIKVSITQSTDYVASTNEVFDVKVSIGTSDSASVSDVTKDTIVSALLNNIKISKWLGEVSLTKDDIKADEITLASGSDGTSLTDDDYINALSLFDNLEDITLIAIPAQTSTKVNDALLKYSDEHGLFPILDMPVNSSVADTKAYRKSITAWTGALCNTWGKVKDSLTNKIKNVPSVGHVMGVYARTIENRGVHKAPAGTEATVEGFVDLVTSVNSTELGQLNSIGVVCIVSRPNLGIVIWGARSLNSTDSTMKYVTDGLLNLSIKKSLYSETQFAVFEPNDETLWGRVQAVCKAILENLRTEGALKGDSDEAYYVTVDSTNNTDDTIAEGQLNIEIGYAPLKPAEFVIIKLAHSIEQS